MAPTPAAGDLVRKMAGEPGIARVQLWTASAKQTPSDTAEMKSRAKDQLAAGAFVVECVRREDAERDREPAAERSARRTRRLGPSAVSVILLSLSGPCADCASILVLER